MRATLFLIVLLLMAGFAIADPTIPPEDPCIDPITGEDLCVGGTDPANTTTDPPINDPYADMCIDPFTGFDYCAADPCLDEFGNFICEDPYLTDPCAGPYPDPYLCGIPVVEDEPDPEPIVIVIDSGGEETQAAPTNTSTASTSGGSEPGMLTWISENLIPALSAAAVAVGGAATGIIIAYKKIMGKKGEEPKE